MDNLEEMPAMNKLQAALAYCQITAVMADTVQNRYIDIYGTKDDTDLLQ